MFDTYSKEHFEVLPLADISNIYYPLCLFFIKSVPIVAQQKSSYNRNYSYNIERTAKPRTGSF